jgi:hypothetical protein
MWNLTVCGEMPSCRAAALLLKPLPTAARTSISRGVSRIGRLLGQWAKGPTSLAEPSHRQSRGDSAQRGIDLGGSGFSREKPGELPICRS